MIMDDSNNIDRPRVLRAKDILPPYDKIVNTSNQNSELRVQSPEDNIPKFDLAQQILAEQRKIAGTKRKRSSGQSKIVEKQSQPVSDVLESRHKQSLSEEIIAQIIARDIQTLLAGVTDMST
jgi:hypothetical protein